ncbi:hypothetical protein [Streptomyces capillispiralis]|uniref:Uncharacterized protein n=1 Tax=Streptomyces capillispiralis TaxID=68182 RepID=A0A561SGA2_9ACTN|nr:hypothetical protein [Streptomyces capillispiralis]TWF73889.1 hypothetical protein FHX78_138 [Streptomyces capillispiralis]GHE24171.1 hypothetical protein GCM10017779_71530 [Streptomyces capillispiralis]
MNHLTDLTVDQWAVAVAVVAAVIAVWQATIARRSAAQQLALAERIHREQNEPYVIVDIQPERNDGSLLLVIENAGPTVARNVRISCDPPLESSWTPVGDEPDLTQVIQQVLARTIPMLPPHRRLTFLLDSRERFKNTELPRVYTFTVNADGPAGAVETLEFTVDLDAVAWALLEDRPTKQLETKLGKIEKAVLALRPGEPSSPTGTLPGRLGQQRPGSVQSGAARPSRAGAVVNAPADDVRQPAGTGGRDEEQPDHAQAGDHHAQQAD